ncbi:MAG: GNAT family N-acetyltransferase [Vicinamibacterales bacterium]|nr:GNAT family N-acetyltransferase [Vicinamibacterales bacterium]
MTADIRTQRLQLRRWLPSDRVPFAALNADPRVMEHFPATLSREESDLMADRIEAKFNAQGFGLWAVELPGTAPFIGFIGLSVPSFETAFTPCVEVGWRLSCDHWSRGYATEGAAAALRHAFEVLKLPEIVAFTAPGNMKSRRVMEKIGMTRDPAEDFDHPLIPIGHPLRRHVLCRIGNPREVRQ